MLLTLTMPKLSPTMESGTIVKWRKKVGDFVEVGDVLFDVATDKATVEYQALDSGWLRKIFIEEGADANVNQPIALTSEEKDESIKEFQLPTEEKVSKKVPAADEAEAVSMKQGAEVKPKREQVSYQQPAFIPEQPLEDYRFEFPRHAMEKRIAASPLAKKMAKEKGLDLSTIKGTGPHQRIVASDLEKAQALGTITFGSREEPKYKPGTYEEIPLTQMRKIISQRVQDSKSFIPHFYVRQEMDIEPLLTIRAQLTAGELKTTINDWIVRACAIALRKHPDINSGFNSTNQSIIQFKTIDISIAVSLEEGLITPIIRHADYKNLGEISIEMKQLAQRAREGKLEAHEYRGGSFSISNLGMYGTTDFQAILNPPQAAILAVGGIQERPVIKNGQVVPGKVMAFTLSVDHRVIDGVKAAVFLKTLKELIENPALLLV